MSSAVGAAFNNLYKQYNDDDDDDDGPVREPPSAQFDVAQPEQQENRIQQQQTASADPPLAADDEDNLVVSEYEEGTRSDQPQQAQADGRKLNRETGGNAVAPRKLYDENGELFWVGEDGPETDALPGGGVQNIVRSAVSGTATAAVEVVKPVLGGVADAVGNPLTDVAEGVGSSLAGMSEGVVKQVNTMLIILGLAYVAGAAVRGGG